MHFSAPGQYVKEKMRTHNINSASQPQWKDKVQIPGSLAESEVVPEDMLKRTAPSALGSLAENFSVKFYFILNFHRVATDNGTDSTIYCHHLQANLTKLISTEK